MSSYFLSYGFSRGDPKVLGMKEELFVMLRDGKINSLDILSMSCIVRISKLLSLYELLMFPPGMKFVMLRPNLSLMILSLSESYSFRCWM